MAAKPLEPLAFRVLESFESIIYLVTAAMLLAIAVAILGYGVYSLARDVGNGFFAAAIAFHEAERALERLTPPWEKTRAHVRLPARGDPEGVRRLTLAGAPSSLSP